MVDIPDIERRRIKEISGSTDFIDKSKVHLEVKASRALSRLWKRYAPSRSLASGKSPLHGEHTDKHRRARHRNIDIPIMLA